MENRSQSPGEHGRSSLIAKVTSMKIIGYGEDALTLWVLTERTEEVLSCLSDNCPFDELLVFFRPSFGRRGSLPTESGATADSSQFGEFDAILGTPSCVYLIETKWSRSRECSGGTISLRREQILRHNVFRAYRSAWQSLGADPTWNSLLDRHEGKLAVGDIFYPIAPSGSQLAKNLESVLNGLRGCGEDMRDVIVCVNIHSSRTPPTTTHTGYTLVTIDCPSSNGFVEINGNALGRTIR